MPRYFFHLHNDIDALDSDGREFPDLKAARKQALLEVRMLFGETAKSEGRIVLHHRVDIEDENGAVMDTVHFGDAVEVKP
jgi:hypothetical protein